MYKETFEPKLGNFLRNIEAAKSKLFLKGKKGI